MTSEPWCPEPPPDGGWENSPGGGVTGHPLTDRAPVDSDRLRSYASAFIARDEPWYEQLRITLRKSADELDALEAEVVAIRERAEKAERERETACSWAAELAGEKRAALGREAKLREALERIAAANSYTEYAYELISIARVALAGADTPPEVIADGLTHEVGHRYWRLNEADTPLSGREDTTP